MAARLSAGPSKLDHRVSANLQQIDDELGIVGAIEHQRFDAATAEASENGP